MFYSLLIIDELLHPGGFLAGLVIPHEGGFAIALVEKLEDIISIVFLPLVSRFGNDRDDKPLTPMGSISLFPD